jgi:hypothetical protein
VEAVNPQRSELAGKSLHCDALHKDGMLKKMTKNFKLFIFIYVFFPYLMPIPYLNSESESVDKKLQLREILLPLTDFHETELKEPNFQ